MNAKRLTTNALLLTIALVMYILEAQIPPPVPVPGIKLGLSNIVIVYALLKVRAKDAFLIMILRVILGSVFGGQIMSFFFSLGGGTLSLIVMTLMKRFVTEKQIWVLSAVGAIFHNTGQICVAMLIFRSAAVAVYLPVLIISGIITGVFTGLAAGFVTKRLNKASAL